MIDIYRAGAVVLSVHPSDSDKVTKKVMGENTLTLSFTLAEAFEFKIGDYLFFDAEKYTLNVLPKVVKSSSDIYAYDLLLEGIEYELRKVRLLFATEAMGIGGGADFSLMGNAALFAQVIVANLNRIQTGWTVGSVIESETKNLTFAGDSCLTAINKVATEFSTEFWIGQDKTVNIGKKGNILPVVFEYGLGNGLYSIERDNVSSKDIITRLYPFGSEQNLPKGYRNNAKRLQIDGDYIEANVDKYGIIESSQNFDDIKPERTGTISGLGADIFTFIDSSMDFDLNAKVDGNTIYLVPGTTAKIHFQSGDLAGYEFELSSYNHATKAFKLVEFTNEIAYKLPNTTLKPAVGDTYIILDIYMPQTYVDAAEARLLAKAQESLAQNSEPNVSYKVAVDPKFVDSSGLTFVAGDYVGIKDTQLLIDRNIRQVSVTRYLNNPNKYEFDLADTVEPSLTTQILTTLERTDLVLQMNKLLDPARARRNWRTVEELRGAIYDVDDYFDVENIKPFSIDTNMLTVGSKGNQFYTDCFFQANYQGGKNNILVGNGSLAHFTIEDSIRTWAVTGISETLPDDNLRYIYITCLKVGNTAQVTLSASQKPIEEGNYYNFFAGVLSSVIDGARQISLLFGFTTINGRFVKTGRVQSADGVTYFDLDSGEIQGKITFKAGSAGYANLTDKPDLSVYSEKTYVDAIKNNLQSQIDGTITSWFFDYEPTLFNVPATNWGDAAVMEIHLGDLFYWTSKGYAYRFQKVGSVFSWSRISDTDVTLALSNAAKAQDTADGKRRVFIAQPTPPYDLGDLWSQGASGDLMKCKIAKDVGTSYAAGDWEKASKYTDDTAAIAAQTAADDAAIIARAMASGKMLNRDPNFKNGWNGISTYNNAGGSALVITRNAAQADSPNYPGGFDMKIAYVGGSVEPGLGGFTFKTECRANAIFLVRLIAYIPVGYNIEWASNSIGTNGEYRWLTPTNGEGRFKEYLCLVKCGSSGTFINTNFFYLKGTAAPVEWRLAFATVYDTTSSESYEVDAANYLKEALRNDTSVQGGLISTTLLKVGAVNQAGVYVERAGVNGAGAGADTPRVYAGGALAQAVERAAGTDNGMAVITEEGKIFGSKGEIAGFSLTPQGFEREQAITEQDGTSFTGKFLLDWLSQAINFMRDGASKVRISSKKLTSGIPTPSSATVPDGAWQNEVDVTETPSYTSPLGQRMVLQPGGYDAAYNFQVRVVTPNAPTNGVIHANVAFYVTLKIWLTDAANNKVRLIASKQVVASNSSNATIQVGFSLENTSGMSHEIAVNVADNSFVISTDPATGETSSYDTSCSAFVKQNSLTYTASSESFEIGYSGLKVLAQSLWFYFNTKDAENKHLRMRGNAALLSKNANTSVDLNDVSLTASRVTLQGVILNLVNKTQNYTIVAADKGIAGIKVVNAAVDVAITLPDLNATDAAGNYYNDNRELTVVATDRNVTVYPSAGQSIRNATYVTIKVNCGYKFVGDRASANWLFVGA